MDHLLEFDADDTIMQVQEMPDSRRMIDIDTLMKASDCRNVTLSMQDWLHRAFRSLSRSLFNDDHNEDFLNYWKEPIKRSEQLTIKIENVRKITLDSLKSLDVMISISLPARAIKLQQARKEVMEYLDEYKRILMHYVEFWVGLLNEYVSAAHNIIRDTYISKKICEKVTKDLHAVVANHMTDSDLNACWISTVHETIDEEAMHCVQRSREYIQKRMEDLYAAMFVKESHPLIGIPQIDLVKWNSPHVDNLLKSTVAYIDTNIIMIMMKILTQYEPYVGNIKLYEYD